ncbi:MAG: phosphate/phosphite/phosphonate ABC transporter substrate-binding protein [Acidimicrobiales bacterium]
MQLVSYLSPGFPALLFELLADRLGAEVTFETATSGPPADQDPFRDGTYDLGWICSTSFVDLALRPPDPSVVLAGVAWVPDDPDSLGRPVYFGDLVVPIGSDIQALSDLAGRRIGCNDVVSLSGHHALRFALADLGEDPSDFAELVFTGGHHRSLDALLAGDLDACVVDSVVRTRRARHDPAVAELPVIERLGPWPVQPLVARAGLDATRLADVRRTLLAADDPDVGAALHDAGLSRLVEVDEHHYASVREALARASTNAQPDSIRRASSMPTISNASAVHR